MTGLEFRQAIETLGLDQEATAAFLGISLRSVNSYANDSATIPAATRMLLQTMVRLKLTPKQVKRYDR